jgi:hypothetical protein
MSDLESLADRIEIEALRGSFTDAAMMHDSDRFASLFTQDGAWRIPQANVSFERREQIRAGIERLQGAWDSFVQNTHPGTIQLQGGTAVGRAYICEIGRLLQMPENTVKTYFLRARLFLRDALYRSVKETRSLE